MNAMLLGTANPDMTGTAADWCSALTLSARRPGAWPFARLHVTGAYGKSVLDTMARKRVG